MLFKLSPRKAQKYKTDLLILAVTKEDLVKKSGHTLWQLDHDLNGLLAKLIRSRGFKAKPGELLSLHSHYKLAAIYVALLGVGEKAEITPEQVRQFAAKAATLGDHFKAKRVAIEVTTDDQSSAVEAAVEGATLARYRFLRYKSRKKVPATVQEFHILCPKKPGPLLDRAITRGEILSEAVCLARDLVNTPATELTPKKLATIAQQQAKSCGLTCKIYGKRELAREKMRLLAAVSAGSHQPPRLVRLSYRSRGAKHSVALVGKGITFDSGGLDLKSAAGMLDMKIDMAGAATVLSTMAAVAMLQPKINVTGYLACSENLLGTAAYKPGDVIVSRSGTSVEIGNTDAEGRLVMADTISLACQQKPDLVIDVATLTGACLVALGPTTAGLFCNNDELAGHFRQAGTSCGEDFWQLPLTAALRDSLKSHIADIRNVGSRYGGAISAALFLREFVADNTSWIHLDIAGPVTSSKSQGYLSKGGTGFGVRTLVHFLEKLADDKSGKTQLTTKQRETKPRTRKK